MTNKNAPPRPTPTPIPTLASGGKPPVSLLESADDSAVEVAVDEKDDIDAGDGDEEGEEVAVAVVPSSSVMLK